MSDTYIYETVLVPKPLIDSINALDAYVDSLGNPPDCSTEAGWKVLDAVVELWEALYPNEVKDWLHDRKIDLAHERSLQEHVKGGTYNPVTYPPRLYRLILLFLPDQSLTDKKFHSKLVKRQLLFKSTNYAV